MSEAFVQVFVKTFVQWFEPSHYIKVPSYMQAAVSQVVRKDSKHLVRSPVVAGLREAYSLYHTGTLMFLFLFSSFFPFSLLNGRLCYGEARAGR